MSEGGEKPSVFGAPSQEEMIARIDATAEDDLSSAFFDSSIQDAENAAVRMFDVGIKTITEDPSAAPSTTFGAPAASAASPTAVAAAPDGAAGTLDDPAVRAAFILGGPAALG